MRFRFWELPAIWLAFRLEKNGGIIDSSVPWLLDLTTEGRMIERMVRR
jgi:hypothetical protein